MNSTVRWCRILKAAGAILMVLGSLDPLEGSLFILLGSGLIALGVYFGRSERRIIGYWGWAFLLIAVGVGAMFALSDLGGIGGKSGHSMWWGLLMLPYPVGWLMALVGGVVGSVRFFKSRRAVHT